jgi:hypothetical protein
MRPTRRSVCGDEGENVASKTLSDLGLYSNLYSISSDEAGATWVWAPTRERDVACESLCEAGHLAYDGVTDGYATYRVVSGAR